MSSYSRCLQEVSVNMVKTILQTRSNLGKLTAVAFVGSIAAVVAAIAQPQFGNAPAVITREGVIRAGSRWLRGAVVLIRTVTTIIPAVTTPVGLDTMFVVAGERIRRTCRTWSG